MNEEEIIKIIKYMLENKNTDINVIINYEAIKGLLDLYNKEKEKNKELSNSYDKLAKECNEENKRCMMLAIEKQDCFEKYRYNLQQNESLTKEFSNVIPVQKIKDKIEELDKEKLKYDNDLRIYTLRNTFDFQKEVLQELLEGGD